MEERKKNSLGLSDSAMAFRRAYKREWNARNRDKVKAAQRRYWEKKAKEAQDERNSV